MITRIANLKTWPSLLLLAVVLVLLVTACGSRETNEIENTQQGAYSEVIVIWQGRKLHCVRFDTGTSNTDDSGLSCDWVAFHAGDTP